MKLLVAEDREKLHPNASDLPRCATEGITLRTFNEMI